MDYMLVKAGSHVTKLHAKEVIEARSVPPSHGASLAAQNDGSIRC